MTAFFQRFSGLGAACVLLAAGVAHAGDPMIEGGRLCTAQFPVQERANNIPTHLLAAISTTESGRWHKGLGMAVPWPWTINVEGKGYYFKNKAEAIAQTRSFLAQGRQSIDVGCMQVNLKHHSKAFRNLEEAFDPETNVAYAAKFLHDNYAELGDWIKATAAYHSRTSARGQEYLVQIERSWNKIVAKVAAARASQSARGGAPAAAAPTQAPKAGKTIAEANAALAEARREMARPAPAVRKSVKDSHPISSTHNVQVVKVNDNGGSGRNASDVLVIRGNPSTPAAAPLVQQYAPTSQPAVTKAVEAPVSQPKSDSVRRVALDNAGAEPQRKDGPAQPKFVFAN